MILIVVSVVFVLMDSFGHKLEKSDNAGILLTIFFTIILIVKYIIKKE